MDALRTTIDYMRYTRRGQPQVLHGVTHVHAFRLIESKKKGKLPRDVCLEPQPTPTCCFIGVRPYPHHSLTATRTHDVVTHTPQHVPHLGKRRRVPSPQVPPAQNTTPPTQTLESVTEVPLVRTSREHYHHHAPYDTADLSLVFVSHEIPDLAISDEQLARWHQFCKALAPGNSFTTSQDEFQRRSLCLPNAETQLCYPLRPRAMAWR